MTMHSRINIRIPLQYLTVDIAFRISTDGTRKRRPVRDVVFADVSGGGDGRWAYVVNGKSVCGSY